MSSNGQTTIYFEGADLEDMTKPGEHLLNMWKDCPLPCKVTYMYIHQQIHLNVMEVYTCEYLCSSYVFGYM